MATFVTWQDTTSNGTQTDYNIIFPFLERSHITVYYNGAAQSSTAYTFTSDTVLKLKTAAANNVVVRVGRDTPQTVLTDFGSAIATEDDLDNSFLQNLYHVQELQDKWDEAVAGAITVSATYPKNNMTATTAPAVTDDSDSSYAVGSMWFDTVAKLTWLATDVTVGAAVWDPINNLNNTTTGAPGVNDDITPGYTVGSLWWATTAGILWYCSDNTNGAAVWLDMTTIAFHLGTQGANIASTSQVDLSAATGNYIHMTGTTGVTELGTVAAGTRVVIKFISALNMTHDNTKLILPGDVDLAIEAGDMGLFVSEGSNLWTLFSLLRASGENVVDSPRDNLIINPNFTIWQRGTSFAAISSGDYHADRFSWGKSGAGVVTISRNTSTRNGLAEFSLKVDVTTADTSIAAGDNYIVRQIIEGFSTIPLGFGSSDAKKITLSFDVKSPKTGIHCISFRNGAANRSYIAEYTIDSADTWERKSVTLTGDTTGTWLKDTGKGLTIAWALAAGSTFHASAKDTWEAGSFISTSSQVNVMDNAANNFFLSEIKLEIGSTTTTLINRPHGQELKLCQRYFANAGGTQIVGVWGSTTTASIGYSYVIPMRVDPTFVLLDTTPVIFQAGSGDKTGTSSTISGSVIGPRAVRLDIDGFSATAAKGAFAVTEDLVSVDAEL